MSKPASLSLCLCKLLVGVIIVTLEVIAPRTWWSCVSRNIAVHVPGLYQVTAAQWRRQTTVSSRSFSGKPVTHIHNWEWLDTMKFETTQLQLEILCGVFLFPLTMPQYALTEYAHCKCGGKALLFKVFSASKCNTVILEKGNDETDYRTEKWIP